jgi:hypothetical protein
MGLILILFFITGICVILVAIGICIDNECLWVPSLVFGALLLSCTVGFSIHGACTQAFIEKDYEAMLLRKQVIEYRMQHEDIITPQDSEDSLYTQIRDFNQEILDTRMFKDNWWIGVFYNHKIATIDYINLDLGE